MAKEKLINFKELVENILEEVKKGRISIDYGTDVILDHVQKVE